MYSIDWMLRFPETKLLESLKPGKVFLLYGPRRTGKTSLLMKFLDTKNREDVFFGLGEDFDLQKIFQNLTLTNLKSLFSGKKFIFIDEAQKLPNVGMGLKMIVDHLPEIIVIASGSSSFELSNQVGEPLTGRCKTFLLYPLSAIELKAQFGGIYLYENLEKHLIFGTYPECMNLKRFDEKKEYLISLRNSYLFKDILELEKIKNSDKLADLLRKLAFQIGQEVSLSELGTSLGLAKQTIEKYLDILEKAFIIKKVRGFSGNLRNEVTKTCRYYFLDNGVRNSIISNFNLISDRDDIGMLWENYLFIERMKKLEYLNIFSNIYFWRTYNQKEIDLVEERDGKLFGFEFKWGKQKKAPQLWFDTYKNASLEFITKENFIEFLT